MGESVMKTVNRFPRVIALLLTWALIPFAGAAENVPAVNPVSSNAAAANPPRWQIDSYFERFRPKMAPRELTKAEREEVRSLLKQHLAADSLYWANWNRAHGKPVVAVRQQATLLRLFELGESGDEEAMLAARTAMAGGFLGLGWGEDAPFDVAGAKVEDDDFAESLAAALVAHWTALIWQRHGPERSREAEMGFKWCLQRQHWTTRSLNTFRARNMWVDCGFSVKIDEKFTQSKVAQQRAVHPLEWLGENYVKKGGKPPYVIVDVYPTAGDEAFDKARFERLLANFSFDQFERDHSSIANARRHDIAWSDGERIWVQHYADTHGRNADLTAMLAKVNSDLAYQERSRALSAQQSRESSCTRDIELMRTTTLQLPSLTYLEQICAEAGDTYLEKFAAYFPLENFRNVERLCAAGSVHCQRQQALMAETQAQIAADREAMKKSFSSGKAPGPASVNVRSYDQQGNYIGTQSMTRGEAELRGAK
jgi:hypothetical protein